MAKDLKKDWKAQSKKLKLPTDKIEIFTESGFPNLSTSKGKETAVSKNPFVFDDVAFYTPENPSGKEKYMAQWKKIFFKNKIENTPGLKDKLSNYFEFMNLDKSIEPGYSILYIFSKLVFYIFILLFIYFGIKLMNILFTRNKYVIMKKK